MGYRLVCLDAGFTLLRPRANAAERLTELLSHHGHRPTEEELHRAWEVADAWFWDDYHRPDNDTWTRDEAIDRTWRHFHSLVLSELGVHADQHELVDAILAAQASPDSWQLYEDVEPALSALREVPEPPTIGIVSDWGSRLTEITDALGLRRWVDFVIASGAVGMAKPSPEIFLHACELADAAPGEALMVGDSLRADVEGARNAGLTGILLDREERPIAGAAEPAADIPVIKSLAELPDLVADGRVGA